MEFPATFRIGLLLAVLAASSPLFAQSSGSEKRQSQPSVPDARRIVALSIAATERSWRARDYYTYTERDDDRRMDALGQIKWENTDVSNMILVDGARFAQHIEHNGQVPPIKERKKLDADLDKLKHETPEEKTTRLRQDQENRSFLEDVLEAFDFHLVGEQTIAGRLAYVIQATPHPGYHAGGKYAKIFPRVEGKLWIDEENFGWIKVDGQVTESFSMGLIVARVQQGSHVILEQTCVGDAVWVPRRLELRAAARIFFVKSLDIDRIFTYWDYRPGTEQPYSASR
jgi:hypothetical protein